MKISLITKLSVLAAMVSFTTIAIAADVQYYVAAKGLNLHQNSPAAPTISTNESPFRFVAEVLGTDTNSVTSVILTLANKQVITLTNQADEDQPADFALEEGFTNKALLDVKYKTGLYKFVIRALNDGSNSATLILPKDLYPALPHIANWNDAQEVESELPFSVRWDAITNVSSGDLVAFSITETNGDPVLSSPGFFQPDALNGTNLFVVIPAGNLSHDHVYDAKLLVVKSAVRNTNSVPNATGVGGYFRQTQFPLVTLPTPGSSSRVQLSSYNYSAGENDGNTVVTVTRVGDEEHSVSVNLATSDGTAVDGTNYLGVNTTLTFAPEVTSTNIIIPILNDYVVTGNRTVNLALSGLTGNAYFGSRSNSVLTIVDAQKTSAGVLQFFTTSATVAEGASTAATLLRLVGKTGIVSAHFHTEDGSAQAGVDYVATNGTITFPANKLGKFTIPVSTINDSLHKTNMNFYLVLDSTAGGAALGTNWFVKVNILDNDPGGVIALSSASYATNENSGAFLVTVTRSGTGTLAGNVSVDFTTQDGTALDGADYSATNGTLTFGPNELTKTVAVPINNDLLAEGDENLSFKLTNPQGGATFSAITNAALTIKDDESSISLSNTTYSVSEAGANVTVTLVRSGPLSASNSVDFATVNGTAIGGSDFIATNGTVTFPANTSTRTVSIKIINDAIVESDENFKFTLLNPSAGVQFGTVTNATVTILNDDFPGTIQFSASSYNGTEGSNAIINLTRTGGVSSGVTVQFTMSGGTATSGVDYSNATQTVTFNAGESNKIILVPIIIDSLNESTETVNLTLSGVTGGATLGGTTTATLNVLNKPDPNAVPLNGPIFIKGTIGSAAFTSLTNGCIATSTSNSVFQVSGFWTTGSGTSTVLNTLTIDYFPRNLGTVTFGNNGSPASATYSTAPFSGAGRAWAVGGGSDSVGSSGTFTLDAIDYTQKLASGRFTLHFREITGNISGGFLEMSGSFRLALVP
jgi:hypothetical protein